MRWTEANRALLEGAPASEVLRRSNLAAAFAGVTRQRVVALLDHIGVHQWLGLRSSVLQVSSVLQFPLLKNGENFRAGWHPERAPMLRQQMRIHFGNMASHARSGLHPGGAAASRGTEWPTEEGFMKKERVLHGIPHPRKEEPDRTAYFLGEKDRTALDEKTHPDKIDAVRIPVKSAYATYTYITKNTLRK